MVKHSKDVVNKAVPHLDAGQMLGVTFDQYFLRHYKADPLEVTRDINTFVVIIIDLYIEMAAPMSLGGWLQESGWIEALVQAEFITAGTVDLLLYSAHFACTRLAHQVTTAILYILMISGL